MQVTNPATMTSRYDVTNPATMTSRYDVTNPVTMTSRYDVTNPATMTSRYDVTNPVTMTSRYDVTDPATYIYIYIYVYIYIYNFVTRTLMPSSSCLRPHAFVLMPSYPRIIGALSIADLANTTCFTPDDIVGTLQVLMWYQSESRSSGELMMC